MEIWYTCWNFVCCCNKCSENSRPKMDSLWLPQCIRWSCHNKASGVLLLPLGRERWVPRYPKLNLFRHMPLRLLSASYHQRLIRRGTARSRQRCDQFAPWPWNSVQRGRISLPWVPQLASPAYLLPPGHACRSYHQSGPENGLLFSIFPRLAFGLINADSLRLKHNLFSVFLVLHGCSYFLFFFFFAATLWKYKYK